MTLAIHRRVTFYAYAGFDLLDLGGTASVFAAAARLKPGAYVRHIVSASGGAIVSSSGIATDTEAAQIQALDTFIVLGGSLEVVRRPPEPILRSILELAANARRIASTCTGAFLLGNAGLLEGRRSTTHWMYAAELQARFPNTRVEADRIFVNDGQVWTSAGGTAGIDLALALVEEDLGTELSRQVARELVVYHRRQGGHPQHSALLDLEPSSDRIHRALSFARDHLHEHLPVRRLAEIASLSERQFGRSFVAATGMTPAKAVERMRAEAARPLVQEARHPLDVIARTVGFSDPEHMRQAFVRHFGQPPRALRSASRRAVS